MRLSATLGSLAAATLALAPLVAGSAHDAPHRRHRFALSARNSSDEHGLAKRGFSHARFSYYDITVAQTACEGWYHASDFVVALNKEQYGTYWKSPHCGDTVTISYNGKTASAKIVDECMGCGYGGLDLTEGLFSYFASKSIGIIYGEWSFGSGGGGGGGGSNDDNNDDSKDNKPTPKHKDPAPTHKATPTHTEDDKPKSTPKPDNNNNDDDGDDDGKKKGDDGDDDDKSTSTRAHHTSTAAPTSTSASTAQATATDTPAGAGPEKKLASDTGKTVKVTASDPQTLNAANYALYGLGNLILTA